MNAHRFLFVAAALILSSAAHTQNYWVPTNGPFSGEMYSLTQARGVCYAGLFGGVYRSIDDGLTWRDAAGAGSTVFALTASSYGRVFAGSQNGVAYTDDSGASWHSRFNPHIVFALVTRGNIVFAGGPSGYVAMSTDSGATFRTMDSGRTFNADVLALQFSSGGMLYAGTYGMGAYRSNDSGKTWTQISNGLPSGVRALMLDEASNILFAGTTTGFFSSAVSGNGWTNIGPTSSPSVSSIARVTQTQALLIGTSEGVFFSTGGTQWTEVDAGITTRDVRAVLPLDSGKWIAATYGDGVFHTVNAGTSWTQTGVTSASIYTLFPLGNRILAGTGDSVFVTLDAGATWRRSNAGLRGRAVESIQLGPGGNIYALTNAGVFISSSDGDAWRDATGSPIPGNPNCLAFTQSGALLVGTSTGLFTQNTVDSLWDTIDLGISFPSVTSLWRHPNGTMYVGTNAGLMRSTTGTGLWTPLVLSASNPIIHAMTVNSHLGWIFAAGESGPVFRSSDDGLTWERVGIGLPPEVGPWGLSMVTTFQGDVFVGMTDSGVYRTNGISGTWQPWSAGLSSRSVWSLAIDFDNYLYAGTARGGVYRSVGRVTGVRESATSLPSNATLWPDPVSDFLTIASPAHGATARVIDALGRTALLTAIPRGESATLDVRTLAPGRYSVVIADGIHSSSRPILIVR